jgi:hypothetical protein
MNKAYNPEWVRNIRVQQAIQSWFGKKMLSAEQTNLAKAAYPENFYRPGIFVKIGLFIFATVACLFASGFLSMFILGASNGEASVCLVSIISAVGFIVMLEVLIRDRKLFHSGVDNALLYASLGACTVPFFILVNNPPVWVCCSFSLALLIPAFLRYADMFCLVGCFGAFITLVVNLMMQFALGAALLPFGIMLFSALIFFLNNGLKSEYYANCQMVLEALCLIAFYFGGNYYVVREGNALINDVAGVIAPQIPFAPVFYSFTLLIPILYIVFGLRRKDRTLLIIGLLAFAFSAHTYRYYFGDFTLEQCITFAGIFMILFSAASIRYLRSPKHNLTDEKQGERKLGNLEAIIISQQLGQTPMEKGVEFGGGNFGGGGAGNTY